MVAAFTNLPGNVRGAIWMLSAAAFFGTQGPLVRLAAAHVDPLVIGFFRSVVFFALMAPWIALNGRTGLRTARPLYQLLRVAFSMAGLITLIVAQTHLPLAEVSSLTFAAPLFGTIGAALLLRETVRARRWTATAIGFAGVWIVLRPGVASVDPLFILPLVSAVFIAASNLMIKSLSRFDSANATVAWLAILSLPCTLVPALFAWQWPPVESWPWLFLIGATGLGAHVCMTRAFHAADISAVLPYDYMRLVMTACLAWIVFGEVPAIWTWIGAAVIVGAVVYIARREGAASRPATVERET